MNQRFERIIDTQQAIRLLRKFETLNLPNMGIQDKYLRILNHYAKDIDYVSRTYQKNKTDPPVARDLPPIAGKLNLSFAPQRLNDSKEYQIVTNHSGGSHVSNSAKKASAT